MIPELIMVIFFTIIATVFGLLIFENNESEATRIKTMNCLELREYRIDNIGVKGKPLIDGNYNLAHDLYSVKSCDDEINLVKLHPNWIGGAGSGKEYKYIIFHNGTRLDVNCFSHVYPFWINSTHYKCGDREPDLVVIDGSES